MFFVVLTPPAGDRPIRREKANSYQFIEFIHASKFAGEEVLTANGPETRAAPWPAFSMKGRTVKSLLRLACAWNPELADAGNPGFSWVPSGLQAYRYVQKCLGESELDWSVLELLNSAALHAEGRAMRHCVYTYANKCAAARAPSGHSACAPTMRKRGWPRLKWTRDATPSSRYAPDGTAGPGFDPVRSSANGLPMPACDTTHAHEHPRESDSSDENP